MIALNPVCKFALSSKPLQSTLEFYLGVTSAADLPPDEAKLLGLEDDDDDRGDEEHGKLSDGEAEDEDADGTTTPRAVDSSSRFSLVAAPPKVKRASAAMRGDGAERLRSSAPSSASSSQPTCRCCATPSSAGGRSAGPS